MPAPFFAAHIRAMLAGPMGIDVLVGSTITRALWDEDGTITADEMGVGFIPRESRVLTVERGSLGTPALETLVKVRHAATGPWESYRIRTPGLPIEDGGLERFLVAPA